jgi:hypothetical protein
MRKLFNSRLLLSLLSSILFAYIIFLQGCFKEQKESPTVVENILITFKSNTSSDEIKEILAFINSKDGYEAKIQSKNDSSIRLKPCKEYILCNNTILAIIPKHGGTDKPIPYLLKALPKPLFDGIESLITTEKPK